MCGEHITSLYEQCTNTKFGRSFCRSAFCARWPAVAQRNTCLSAIRASLTPNASVQSLSAMRKVRPDSVITAVARMIN